MEKDTAGCRVHHHKFIVTGGLYMKWRNGIPREYYSKYEKISLKNDQGWFETYRLPGDIYAICEPQHFQEVNAYLIIGKDQSLLLDTGMGICDIKAVVSELYQGKIMVVNSHFHFDHIGDNHRFAEVHIFDDPYAKAIAETGLPKEGLGNQLEEDMFLIDYPKDFEPDNFKIKPYKIKLIHESHRFDLGNRSIKVIHTPGHSNDSIMLFDDINKILFTGGTFYLGALYAHFDCDEFGKSNVENYYETMNSLLEKCPDVKALYCSHNDFIADPIKISETSSALKSILSNHANTAVPTKQLTSIWRMRKN
jgi:glyoxylase-like metal-dependent hydrolase (beta-lactamase superfamily II)